MKLVELLLATWFLVASPIAHCLWKGNIGRRHSVAMLVGYYFHMITLPHCHAWVCRPKIDTDCRTLFFTSHSYFWYEPHTHFVSIVTERDVDAEEQLSLFFFSFFDRNGLCFWKAQLHLVVMIPLLHLTLEPPM